MSKFIAGAQKYGKQPTIVKQGTNGAPAYSSYNYPSALDTTYICVILMDFTNKTHDSSHTKTYYYNKIFNPNTSSISKYYKESSYGKFTIAGAEIDIYGWYQSDHTMEYYGADNWNDIDSLNGNIYELAREAVNKAALAGVDFTKYDVNNDGVVDHLIIIHSGDDQAAGGSSSSIWSHQWFIGGDNNPEFYTPPNNTKKVSPYCTFAENSPLGIIVHEFGHTLGLFDLYNTRLASNNQIVGMWDVMDYGLWSINGTGSTPCYHSVFHKIQLG